MCDISGYIRYDLDILLTPHYMFYFTSASSSSSFHQAIICIEPTPTPILTITISKQDARVRKTKKNTRILNTIPTATKKKDKMKLGRRK